MIPSASPPARKPHVKRGPTSAQIAALAVVAALVVAGALASDSAPTGHGVVEPEAGIAACVSKPFVLDEDGCVAVPQTPGLGIELDEDGLKEVMRQPWSERRG